MQIKDIIREIERLAPPVYQESYDNSGLQIGDINMECSGVIISLDATTQIVQDAIDKNSNLIITHHPLLFKGLKKIIGQNDIDKVVIQCIKNDITLYACHTNLDNVMEGVNYKIADKLKLQNTEILDPTHNNLYKLITYIPIEESGKVLEALFDAGAGHIGNYSECSFQMEGTGTFKGNEDSNPQLGEKGKRMKVKENRIEVLVNISNYQKIIAALKKSHPYEEVAYELIPLRNENQTIGAGVIGYLENEMTQKEFLKHVKQSMNLDVIKYTFQSKKMIRKVGICGGSGAFLINNAMYQNCDAYISGDIKYHEFFQAEDKMMILDIGHYESEQYTSEIFYDIIKNKFPNFAVQISALTTNPIKFYY